MNMRKRLFALAAAFVLLALSLSSCSRREKQGSMEFVLNEDKRSYTLVFYTDTTSQTELVIPDTFQDKPVTAIGRLAINSADSLEKIVIGKNITSIDPWGITRNIHLKEIVVDPENPNYCTVDKVLFTKDKTKLLTYPNACEAEYNKDGKLLKMVSYTVPEGTKTIGHCAFYHCYGIEKLTLLDSVTVIEERAFHKMTNLIALDLGNSIQTIGNDALLGCELLTEVTIPGTIQEIGDYVFYNAKKMERIRIGAQENAVKLGYKWVPSSAGGKLDHELTIEWGWLGD